MSNKAKEILQAGLAKSRARNPDHTPIVEIPVKRCDQCEMLSINGVACHELGCPNRSSVWNEERGRWIKQRECRECGTVIELGEICSCESGES